jgi:hypothetical protein
MASLARVAAYKAHWVAKGYAQIKGLHSNDIHASVVPKDSIQVFLFSVISLAWNVIRLTPKPLS